MLTFRATNLEVLSRDEEVNWTVTSKVGSFLTPHPAHHEFSRRRQDVVNSAQSKAEGQRDENFNAVSSPARQSKSANWLSGLDNAGKTTIVKKIMGEDVNTVSPTLGFIIKTIDYGG